jgi:hypothetical protein
MSDADGPLLYESARQGLALLDLVRFVRES